MSFKQFMINKLTQFFMLTTFISVAICIIGLKFDKGTVFGYEAYLSPLIFAGACIVPTLVTYSKKELSIKELIPRMVLEFILIEAVVLGIAVSSPEIDTTRPEVVVALLFSVLIVYLLVCLVEWLKESAEAKQMNEDLLRIQKRYGE